MVGQYEAYLEKRVADALECVEGVGKTEVVITLKSSGQKVIEKDQISNSRTTTEEDSAGGTRVEKEGETEKTSIYEQREDGSQTPYVSREMLPEVEGVAVIEMCIRDRVLTILHSFRGKQKKNFHYFLIRYVETTGLLK